MERFGRSMICANKECAKNFEPKTHNQKYCSDDCCRVATNKRIMEKYYEKKAIRSGAIRVCKVCKTQLSRYNDTNICVICNKKMQKDLTNKSNILRMINEIS
ncbi:MAG: hypothetical protein RLZZ196_898 [Bacteroidota bacterium]|jgi:hypothetical protein